MENREFWSYETASCDEFQYGGESASDRAIQGLGFSLKSAQRTQEPTANERAHVHTHTYTLPITQDIRSNENGHTDQDMYSCFNLFLIQKPAS